MVGSETNGARALSDRLAAIERWRDTVDTERGTIMGDLGYIRGTIETLSTLMSANFKELGDRLSAIEEQLDERPSRAELKTAERNAERQIESIRAKTKGGITKFEITGPQNFAMKLFGVSGVTIVIVVFLLFVLIAAVVAIYFLLKK